jgi:hypothetical protein
LIPTFEAKLYFFGVFKLNQYEALR